MKKPPFFTDEERRKLSEECCGPRKEPKFISVNQSGIACPGIIERIKDFRESSLDRCKVYNPESKDTTYLLPCFHGNKGIYSEYLRDEDSITDIENYKLAEKDNFEGWVIHHRLETRGFGYTCYELMALGLYYKRPASELIYLNTKEHGLTHSSYNQIAKQIRNNLVQYIK